MVTHAHSVDRSAEEASRSDVSDRLSNIRLTNAARRDLAEARLKTESGRPDSALRAASGGSDDSLNQHAKSRNPTEGSLPILTSTNRLTEASENQLAQKAQRELDATTGLSPDQASARAPEVQRDGYKHAVHVPEPTSTMPIEQAKAPEKFEGLLAGMDFKGWQTEKSVANMAQGNDIVEHPPQTNLALNEELARGRSSGMSPVPA